MKYDISCEYERRVSLSSLSSMKVGGEAKVVYYPDGAERFIEVIKAARASGERYIVIGNASNIIFSDEGFDGVIISTFKMNGIELSTQGFIAGAGAPLSSVASFAAKAGLSGLEFAYGIPGTVGGAVYMNAGAYGGEMKDCVGAVLCYDAKKGKVLNLCAEELCFGYRKSLFQSGELYALNVEFLLSKGDIEEIIAKMSENMRRRRDKQPLEYPSCGSTFKRPEGDFAGALIEKAGLKGFSIGSAQVSEKHAGFIINRGGASASDIVRLIEYVQKKVFEATGVLLETEVEIFR